MKAKLLTSSTGLSNVVRILEYMLIDGMAKLILWRKEKKDAKSSSNVLRARIENGRLLSFGVVEDEVLQEYSQAQMKLKA